MKTAAYNAAMERLGLTQSGAADFLGVSIRTAHAYANGATIPPATAKLLRLMLRLNLTPSDVR